MGGGGGGGGGAGVADEWLAQQGRPLMPSRPPLAPPPLGGAQEGPRQLESDPHSPMSSTTGTSGAEDMMFMLCGEDRSLGYVGEGALRERGGREEEGGGGGQGQGEGRQTGGVWTFPSPPYGEVGELQIPGHWNGA